MTPEYPTNKDRIMLPTLDARGVTRALLRAASPVVLVFLLVVLAGVGGYLLGRLS